MANLNSTTVNGNLNVASNIIENGEILDKVFITSIKNIKPTLSSYDSEIYTEPDGTRWAHVFHHDPNGGNNLFSSSDNFANGVYKNENAWFDVKKITDQLNTCKLWGIILVQRNTSSSASTQVYRFIQYINPMSATFNDTLAAKIYKFTSSTDTNFSDSGQISNMSGSYGGIYYNSNNSTYLVQNNSTSGNWFGATGCWTKYSTGIPGYNGSTTSTGSMDMYIWIDPIYTQVKMYNADGEQKGSTLSTIV